MGVVAPGEKERHFSGCTLHDAETRSLQSFTQFPFKKETPQEKLIFLLSEMDILQTTVKLIILNCVTDM